MTNRQDRPHTVIEKHYINAAQGLGNPIEFAKSSENFCWRRYGDSERIKDLEACLKIDDKETRELVQKMIKDRVYEADRIEEAQERFRTLGNALKKINEDLVKTATAEACTKKS